MSQVGHFFQDGFRGGMQAQALPGTPVQRESPRNRTPPVPHAGKPDALSARSRGRRGRGRDTEERRGQHEKGRHPAREEVRAATGASFGP